MKPPESTMRPSHLIAAFALVGGTAVQAQTPQRFVIEREIPGASKMTSEQLRDAARQSNRMPKGMGKDMRKGKGKDIPWLQRHVADDRICCVCNASSQALIREHAQKAGFPANRTTPVAAIIDPSAAQDGR